MTTTVRDAQQIHRLASAIAASITRKAPTPVRSLDLMLTEQCTFRCDYCFVATKKASHRMSWHVAKASVDFLMTASSTAQDVQIGFFGGEPLLAFQLMRRIAEYAEEVAEACGKRISYIATINGSLVTKEMALFARDHRFCYLLSVDGDREAHDLHRKTLGGKGTWDIIMGPKFDLLKSVQGWAAARITVSPDTVSRLSAGVRVLLNRGVNEFIIAPDLDTPWTGQEMLLWERELNELAEFYVAERGKGSPISIGLFDEALHEMRTKRKGTWGCGAGRGKLAVAYDGDLYPCARFVSPFRGMEGRFRLGSVFEGVTNRIPIDAFWETTDEFRPACQRCAYRDLCGGGCPATNYHMNGDVRAPQQMGCLFTRTRADLSDLIHGGHKLGGSPCSTGFSSARPESCSEA